MTTRLTDGILLLDKPAGVSSHDAVGIVRRSRGGVRAGHSGTLDPFATGLLLVALGRATRLIRFLPAEPKVYSASITFGAATDTDDATGNVVEEQPAPIETAVTEAIHQLTGTIEQLPPAFSAKHVGGRRAYEVARTGVMPDLSPSTITVHSWQIASFVDGTLVANITCSSGTYIRALARDLGRLCGSAAHLSALRRRQIGPFDVADAVLPHEAGDAQPLASADALIGMTRQVVAGEDVIHAKHGRAVTARAAGPNAALVDENGQLVAVAERDGEQWQPRVVLPDE